MPRMTMSEADHKIVTAAVAQAELKTDAEVVTIVARRSDEYQDIALHWAMLASLIVLALVAVFPQHYERTLIDLTAAWSHELPTRFLLAVLLGLMLTAYLAVRLLLAASPSLRMSLTPGASKSRRVRRRALLLFRTAAEARTARLTGVLIYLSLDEHRAEIVTDAAIASRVAPEMWGDAMAAMVDEVREGRIAEGMARAVEKAGAILAEHCPPSGINPNELPDRLIEL